MKLAAREMSMKLQHGILLVELPPLHIYVFKSGYKRVNRFYRRRAVDI